MAKLLIVLAAAVAMCAASSIREKRQVVTNVNCPQNNGPIADISDCSFFFQCDNGIATRLACVAGLEFNPLIAQCDYPNNLANPQCQRVSVSSTRNVPCQGLANTALVPHPSYCNAFMVCGNGFLHDGCSFCSAGQYFDATSGKCTATYNVDTNRICNGKQMVPREVQEVSRLDGSCWPSDPNRFVVLIEKIRREGGGFRPVNNRGFLSN